MIKVVINYQNNILNNVSIKGHANYAEYNKDIVCASVSSIAMTTINAILSLDNSFKYVEKENELVLYNNCEVANKLLNNMIRMLEELATNYKKNINIRKEEK